MNQIAYAVTHFRPKKVQDQSQGRRGASFTIVEEANEHNSSDTSQGTCKLDALTCCIAIYIHVGHLCESRLRRNLLGYQCQECVSNKSLEE